MTGKPARTALTLILAMTALHAAGAEAPNAERGRALYVRHCQTCHAPGIHGRTQMRPATRDDLRMLVDTFRRQAGLAWTREDIDDVVEHLDTMGYRFPPAKGP